MDEEMFKSRLPSWAESVKVAYPVDEAVQDWHIDATEKDGVPIFDTMKPTLRLLPRYSKKSSQDGFDWSIRCPRGQLTMNMHSGPEDATQRRFDDLKAEYLIWLGKWMKHFDVTRLDKLVLHYVNALTSSTLPNFVDDKGRLKIGNVIKVFTQIPGKHESIIAPYECCVTLLLGEEPRTTLAIYLNEWPFLHFGTGIKLDFKVEIHCKSTAPIAVSDVSDMLDTAHGHIIDRFETVFSDEAKQSFDPVAQ
jgi:hypothetical protein